jgi:hypothetical protein
MANTLLESGRNALLNGTASFAFGMGTSGTPGSIMACLISPTIFTGAGIKSITGITTATPPVVTTSAAHGFTTGDTVVIGGVTTGNYNGIWTIAAASGSVFTLTDYITGAGPGSLSNVVGAGTFAGAAAWVLNLGPSASGATWNSFLACLVGSGVALSGLTEANGIADASTTLFTAVSGSQVAGIMLVATVTAGTLATSSIPIAWIDGQQIVTTSAVVSAATTLPVERLAAAIPNATAVLFDDGTTGTLTAVGVQFARSLTVSSYTNTVAGARGSAPATGSGLPVTPNGGNISITWDSVGSQHVGIFKL